MRRHLNVGEAGLDVGTVGAVVVLSGHAGLRVHHLGRAVAPRLIHQVVSQDGGVVLRGARKGQHRQMHYIVENKWAGALRLLLRMFNKSVAAKSQGVVPLKSDLNFLPASQPTSKNKLHEHCNLCVKATMTGQADVP